jgi:hypothetical protein
MRKSPLFPRVVSVDPLPNKFLLVTFSNGEQRSYNCAPLLNEEVFFDLKNDGIFNSVHRGAGGYGVVWNDEIDLSESELWLHGKPLPTKKPIRPASRRPTHRRPSGHFHAQRG